MRNSIEEGSHGDHNEEGSLMRKVAIETIMRKV